MMMTTKTMTTTITNAKMKVISTVALKKNKNLIAKIV